MLAFSMNAEFPTSLPYTVYCERGTSLELWAEPLTALTNVAFLVVAAALWRRRERAVLRVVAVLSALTAFGSFAWHTVPSTITLVADAVFLLTTIAICLTAALASVLRTWPRALVAMAAFIAIQIVMSAVLPRDFLNDSGRHVLNVVVVAALASWAWRFSAARPWAALTLACYGLAVAARIVDRELCAVIPVGTHFIWHVSGAAAVYCGARLLENLPRARTRKGTGA